MRHDIRVIDNIFPITLYDELASLLAWLPMTYGSRSNSRTDPHGHWTTKFVSGGKHNLADMSLELEQNGEFGSVRNAWNFVREGHLADTTLIRCYCNGYTYGTDGYFHSDSLRADENTAIVYMNDSWEADWGGDTAFLNDEGEIIHSVLPKRNRVVIFPANIVHAGRSLSRKCTVLRKTFILKVRETRTPDFEKLSSFLVKHKAHCYGHKKGSLHDHLVRTYSILAKKGRDRHVCFAGGLHSIYGTNIYRHSILASDQRHLVATEFGEEAERLAQIFSRLERPRSLESPVSFGSSAASVLLSDGNSAELSRDLFDDLRSIECANLEDQRSLSKHPNLSLYWNS